MDQNNETKKAYPEGSPRPAEGQERAAAAGKSSGAEEDIRPEDLEWLDERTKRNRNIYGVEINPDDPFGLKEGLDLEEESPSADTGNETGDEEEAPRRKPGMKTNVFFDLFQDYGNIVVPVIAIAAILLYIAATRFHLF